MVTREYPPEFYERHILGDVRTPSGGRSVFERDRDRILYSSAFSSLAAKTQVVASTELGFLHNRLTHSLKVAQIGKAIASRLARDGGAGVDPVLVEAACLAHDIGHPPFGHAGEEALDLVIEGFRKEAWAERNEELRGTGDPELPEPVAWDGFEGNAQNLRVLTRLAVRGLGNGPGLHLTRATLLATTKYPWTRHPDRKGGRKWGAYEGDRPALEWMVEHTPLADGQPGRMFEQVLMDWADDVTYAVHDVDDWYRSGMVPLHQLFEFRLGADHPRAGGEENAYLGPFLDFVEEKWTQAGVAFDRTEVVKLLHILQDRVHVDQPFDGTRHSKGSLDATVSDLISFFVNGVTFTGEGQAYEGELVVPPEQRLLCSTLQELVWFYVIQGPALAAQQHGQSRIIRRLTKWLHDDHGRLLPKDRQEELDEHGDLTRAIADHVASLTEPMAINLYGKLSGNSLGAITDSI